MRLPFSVSDFIEREAGKVSTGIFVSLIGIFSWWLIKFPKALEITMLGLGWAALAMNSDKGTSKDQK